MTNSSIEGIYTAAELSDYILSKCTRDNKFISNLQLQKILFFIQKKILTEYGVPIFKDDIEAWKFGPVVPEVYYKYCSKGNSPLIILEYVRFKENSDVQKIIDKIIEEKRKKYIWDLVEETHENGGAWDRTFAGGRGNHKPIPIDFIKKCG